MSRRESRAAAKKRRNRQRLSTMKLRRLVDFSRQADRPNRVTSIGPIDIMRARCQLSVEAHWSGQRFAAGWEARNGGASIAAASLEYMPGSGRPTGPQERITRLAQDFEMACKEMDAIDAAAGRRPITRYIVQAVCCELMALEAIDRLLCVRKGAASKVLATGLATLARLWGGAFEEERRSAA